jgi:hypothetical protein
LGKHTINDWVAITKNEKSGWSDFYRDLLGQPLSDIPRFLKAVSDFGHSIMFESIIATSTKKLTGDPLNYVIGVAVSKASDISKDATEDARYKMRLEKSKMRIAQQNEELEDKYERARQSVDKQKG